MSGILYLCATPIGNLEDITLRVIKTLEEVDLIAAEDTRHSIKLLNHLGIKTPMTSYHEHNKLEKAGFIIEKLKAGLNIALITDAGTPAISDPGEELVRLAYEEDIEVTSLPGASAVITALTLSGLSTRRFCFEAFLPTDKKERQYIIEGLKTETSTIIIYEAPHRLLRTLKELYRELGDRDISIIKELTKRYESVDRTTLAASVELYTSKEIRGEHVLVLAGRAYEELIIEEKNKWGKISIEEHMKLYIDQGFDKKESMKAVAKDRGISKREIYQMLLRED